MKKLILGLLALTSFGAYAQSCNTVSACHYEIAQYKERLETLKTMTRQFNMEVTKVANAPLQVNQEITIEEEMNSSSFFSDEYSVSSPYGGSMRYPSVKYSFRFRGNALEAQVDWVNKSRVMAVSFDSRAEYVTLSGPWFSGESKTCEYHIKRDAGSRAIVGLEERSGGCRTLNGKVFKRL